MLQRIFELSLENRFLVLILTALLVVGGIVALKDLPIDAVPDITPVQVQILTKTAPMGPVEVERSITFPIEAAMSGLPDLQELRSVSRFGLSAVTVVFKDHVNVYFARQLIAERLSAAKGQIPVGFGTPEMGPVTTGLGEVYQFVVRGEGYTPMQLREILDWQIAYRLRGVPGVTEISAEGGYAKQYHVMVDRARLVSYRIPIDRVFEALEKNNAIAGGGYIEHSGEAYLIRGEGLVERSEDLLRIVVGVGPGGTPITIAQLGQVKIDAMPRIGAATRNGEGEAVIAMTLMLWGGNGRVVAELVKQEIERILPTLPPGISVEPFYDRSDLVNKVIRTVTTNLLEGAMLVIAVLLLLLGNLRGGLIVASAIPLSMLVAFTGMIQTGISGNLMSLGAIDFGLIVDGAVVMIENIVRHLAKERGVRREERPLIILRAGREVLRPIFFAVSIIVIVYLPILTLQGVEGKMFRPMAFTVIFALIASLILSFTLMPVLASLFLRGPIAEGDSWLLRRAKTLYLPRLAWCVHHPKVTALVAASAFVLSLILVPFLGGEFIPQLDEGDITIQAWRPPSIALSESLKSTLEIERTLLHFPEVRQVVSRTGTAEIATDVMGMELSDIFVSLRPRRQWKSARTKEELIAKFAAALSSEVPGVSIGFTQPIEMRFNELIAGVRSDVGLKIFGDDLKILKEKGDRAAHILRQIGGGQDIRVEQIAGLPVLRIQVDRQRIARYGINVADVLAAVEAAGAGRIVGTVFEGQRRFPLVVRVVGSSPTDLPSFQDLPVAAPNGALIPLAQLASVSVEEGPAQVSREDISRRIVVEANVRGRDLSSFVREAQTRIARDLTLPPGYYMKWGGQFENLERATRRLAIVVPLSLFLIFVLLYMTFNAVRPALLIFLNVPLAVTGGVAALALRGLPFSISAGVGFIALFGVAVLNGVVLMSYILQLREEGLSPADAALKAAEIRLRPVLMTALVAGLGFVPMALSTGVGAEVQRPLATVVIGGLVTSTLLTLFVLPSLYRWFEREATDST
ncbi:CusA/CzcA family heavy metal efflux RND transporter [Candidatus Methylomirabilis limnetica]|uniref:CusA/CzcA family heavy metal efflux RND transporter n=1 Tax=Candidatus Methylomirabilis limnetica TaxID=2033718 RepID=A0A2T4TZD9_9BACT|nr:CusA/CzcA family heavy metal efflux RND transporter [Candidatus Methylomirabilis limnetica]PTL36480.1 CusA/CzcA family heavy metal efflux RND transporter [Candidatus Methylomirabilis limnetica]